ncbi:MAG: hypothetical protein JW946_05740, partial [Candidatus Omnitrophica bacterium]|nr:hypothetical protein [Candidatus Omnitrophota bacterium]
MQVKRAAILKVKKEKISFIFGTVFLCMALIWLWYILCGRQVVESAYEGKSIAILNRLISGQNSYALEYYNRFADALFAYSFFSFVIFALSFTGFYFCSPWTLLGRLLVSSGVTALLLSIILTAQRIVVSPECCWNSGRLAWTLAPAYGYKLYYGNGAGPSLSTLYGPIAALAYLPAVFCSSATLAIQCASFLAACFYFSPILGLYICEHIKKAGSLSNIICVSAFFCLITLSLTPLHAAFSVCPDAPALGLSAFACLILYYRKNNGSLPFLLSSIFSVLAVWTKQTFVPILLALPFYVLLVDGVRYFKRYILFMFISGLVVSGIFLWFFDPQDLFFCMFI